MNHVDKYYWVIDHPKLTNKYGTQPVIELTPHMVNPDNNTIMDDVTLNTKSQWWIEVNVANIDFNPKSVPFSENSHEYMHDWNLDCGGNSAEDAVDMLYQLVLEHYGGY